MGRMGIMKKLFALIGERMRRRMLHLFSGMLLFWTAAFATAGERFIVTEHDTSGFVVEHRVGVAEFVVTDRALPVSTPVATKRPVVLLYSATWCTPCRIARRELERSQLPFEIRVVDVTAGGQPEYVDSIPYFEWHSPRGRWFAKWTSVAELIRRWELTR